MDHHDGLMLGMFWGGLLVASVPILLTLGVGICVFLRWREDAPPRSSTEPDR